MAGLGFIFGGEGAKVFITVLKPYEKTRYYST